MIVKKLLHKCTRISTSGILSTSLCSLKTHHIYFSEHQNNGTLEQQNEARMQRIQVRPFVSFSPMTAIMELRSIANSCQQSFKISTQLLRHLTISVGKQKWVWQHSY